MMFYMTAMSSTDPLKVFGTFVFLKIASDKLHTTHTIDENKRMNIIFEAYEEV